MQPLPSQFCSALAENLSQQTGLPVFASFFNISELKTVITPVYAFRKEQIEIEK